MSSPFKNRKDGWKRWFLGEEYDRLLATFRAREIQLTAAEGTIAGLRTQMDAQLGEISTRDDAIGNLKIEVAGLRAGRQKDQTDMCDLKKQTANAQEALRDVLHAKSSPGPPNEEPQTQNANLQLRIQELEEAARVREERDKDKPRIVRDWGPPRDDAEKLWRCIEERDNLKAELEIARGRN